MQQPRTPPEFGTFPTPLGVLSTHHAELWIKNDGESAPTYGGNKVRKLRRLLALAVAQGKTRVLTVGAAGSHHVLATTLFAKQCGLQTAALLTPQPHTAHAEETLRAALGAGLQAVALADATGLRAVTELPWAFAKLKRRGDFVIGPGAMGIEGTLSYADAVSELQEQLELGKSPPADIVVAAGSGSTAAGLLAGIRMLGWNTRVRAVCCAPANGMKGLILGQAALALRRQGHEMATGWLADHLDLDESELGRGYGSPGPGRDAARRLANTVQLTLDQTYTEKSLASALTALSAQKPKQNHGAALGAAGWSLYWHTLSAAPLGAHLQNAPALRDLPRSLQALFFTPPSQGPTAR